MSIMVITRFAPSPTGHLHVGNIRTALFNFLLARAGDGRFILRFDDTDRERSREEFLDSARRDLEWLGLCWDEEVRQSERIERYDEQAEALRARGLLYECFESREELALKRKLQLQRGHPPIYDRASLRLSDMERDSMRANSDGYWRYLLDGRTVEWHDGVQGPVSIGTSNVSDPVLVRADGQYLYTFASVIDDLDMGITDIVRGSDHLTNTAVQVSIMQAFGSDLPRFAHHSLLVGPSGAPLAKRDGSLSIASLREQGIEPMAILVQLAGLGSSRAVESCATVSELVDRFRLSDFSTAPSRYDVTDLPALTGEHYRRLGYDHVSERVRQLGVPDPIARDFWNVLRANIMQFYELEEWWHLLSDGTGGSVDEADRELVTDALARLPDPPYDSETWDHWTKEVGRTNGRKGRGLYQPLRLALTGRREGPSMRDLMPLIGQASECKIAIAVARISAEEDDHTASLELLREKIPDYSNLTSRELLPSKTRPGEQMWHQIIRNIKSHDTSQGNFIHEGYLEHVPGGGYRVTPKGIAFVESLERSQQTPPIE